MVKGKLTSALILAAALALQIGCSGIVSTKENTKGASTLPVHSTTTSESTSANSEKESLIDSFNDLMSGKPEINDVVDFIDTNISKASKEDASTMIIAFEDFQKAKLPELRISNLEAFSKGLEEVYKPGFSLADANQVKDESLKKILQEIYENGYKVETAEGMYFTVINYSFYKQYSGYVTDDIRSYIELMSVESDNMPAKDAALVITWDELLQRSLNQEKFIVQYSDSKRVKQIKELYSKYCTFTLYGLNNTPLFDYQTKTMNAQAKEAYSKIAASGNDTAYVKMIKEYMNLLQKNNYKQTNEIKKFQEKNDPAYGC